MGATGSGHVEVSAWTTENSALFTLVVGAAGTVFAGPGTGDPGLAGSAATVVAAAVVLCAGCLGVGLLGRLVDLPFPRTRALEAAVFLGFGAVIANGLLAARSMWLTGGPGRVLALVALVVVIVGAVLGGVMALGQGADS